MTEETIFEVALGKRDPAERSAYLARACGGDPRLRQRVEALLASHERIGSFLEHPAVEQMAAPPSPQGVTSAESHGDGEENDLGFLQPSERPGSLGRLAHYEVLEVLGRGGCGVVMRAFDEKLHRMVAVKVMAPQLAVTSPARKRFLREARAAAAIRHENVVGIYAVEDQPTPYLVMEYIPGQTLQQALDRLGPLDVLETLHIGRQIASGLAAAHALGLIHRDVKPANILLDNGVERRVKITDFGLARAADDASLTQSGMIAGTPLYMAPEQARGEAIDQRADLFGLGSVLYVMCSGRPPFRASTALAVLKRVTEDTPRPIREIIPEVPKWLCAIIARLHAKEPADRFASAQEVADLLARHLAKLQRDRGQQPVPAVPRALPRPTPAKRKPAPGARPTSEKERSAEAALRPVPRRKWLWATVVAVLFLLLAGLGWGLVGVVMKDRLAARLGKDASPDADRGEKPGAAPTPTRQARRSLDLKYIPADACAAVVFHPRRIVRSPLLAGALPPGSAGEMLKGLGVEPEQVEQVIVLLLAGTSGGPAVAPPPKDDWTELKSKEGRFSVRFPVEPKAQERKTLMGARRAFTAGGAGNLTFEVSYVDFARDSPFVGDRSRVDFATRAFEFKPGFQSNKDIKLGKHLGAEVVLDDVQLGTYSVHRVYVVGDRLYNLEAKARKTRKPPAEFARFFDSFQLTGAAAPAPGGPPPELASVPAAVIRLAGSVDGKQVLTRLLKGLREEKHKGKTYYRSSTGEAILGLPLAGAIPDVHTILLAPEPVLRKMLTADGGARAPLLDRLRLTDDADEITGIVIVEPYRNLLKGLIGPFAEGLPANLADAAKLPDRLASVTATVNLRDKTLLKVSLEAGSEEDVEGLDQLAFQGLNWARKVYPGVRPALLKQVPAEFVRPALAIVDQLYGGIRVTKEGKRLVVRVERPDSLGNQAAPDLIASSGFNDASGMNSDPTPDSPYPLDSAGKQGGVGEPGWARPWSTRSSPRFSFQKKVVYEGDGALHMSKGSADRKLVEALGGRFQVEMRVQVPAGGGFICYWKNGSRPWASDGPVWSAGDGKFGVLGDDDKFRTTDFSPEPGKWHKVTLRVDVARNEWEFFVDDQKFATPRPLRFRRAQASLDTIWFQCETEAGVFIDALRITRQGEVGPPPKDLIASSGFNDTKGMNSNPVPGSPFPLDTPNREGGLGEPGWKGPWPASADAVYQRKVVFEGDGALYLKGRPNFGPYHRRVLALPQTGRFQLEYHVQVPAGTNYALQFWPDYDSGPFGSGPISAVQNGKFIGNGLVDTGFKCEPGRWYKVTMRIDVPKQNWELLVDDKPFAPTKPLGFRAKVTHLSCLNFIVGEGGAYIDAVRVTRLPDAAK